MDKKDAYGYIIVPDSLMSPGKLVIAFVSDLRNCDWTRVTCPVCKESVRGRLLGHLLEEHDVRHNFFTSPMVCICGAEFVLMRELYDHLRERGDQCILIHLMGQ